MSRFDCAIHRSFRWDIATVFQAVCCWSAVSSATALSAGEPLVIHEWGTFTALQDEKGVALPGINIDDEKLPEFCHNLSPWILSNSYSIGDLRSRMMKGAPPKHPYVTLRLETPVLYVHPPKDEKLPFQLDVEVAFHGGWLTEFYPHADAEAPGLKNGYFNFGPITAETVGKLTWKNVTVGAKTTGPETDANVWLAPRKVAATDLSVPPPTDRIKVTESERFLFYRGVAHRPVPLKVTHDEARQEFTLFSQADDVYGCKTSGKVPALWLVDIRTDGKVAFRTIDPVTISFQNPDPLVKVSSHFSESDYATDHLSKLRLIIHKALVVDGLFDDEATAMLNTWERAYFKSPGLRLFFLVPQTWTDAVIPLKVSREAEIKRVMMGRIELISVEQRALLKKLSALESTDYTWMRKIAPSPNLEMFMAGRIDFGDLGVKIPDDYQTYLNLGRFRNALILYEQQVRPTPQLARFILGYELFAGVVPGEKPKDAE